MDHCPVQLSSERLHPETDGNSHNQTLGRPWAILWEMGRKGYGSPRAKDTMGKHRESSHLGACELTETKPPARTCIKLTCVLCLCYGCVTWSSCGTPGRSRGWLWLCFLPLRSFPPAQLPCLALTREEVPNLAVTWYPSAGWSTWKMFIFFLR